MKTFEGDDMSEQEENWKQYMLSTYSNGRMPWDHEKMFDELISELQTAIYDGVITVEAGRKLVNMINNQKFEEARGTMSSINWQDNYKYFMTWYKFFQECGHINYEIKGKKDQNFNLIDNTIK